MVVAVTDRIQSLTVAANSESATDFDLIKDILCHCPCQRWIDPRGRREMVIRFLVTDYSEIVQISQHHRFVAALVADCNPGLESYSMKHPLGKMLIVAEVQGRWIGRG